MFTLIILFMMQFNINNKLNKVKNKAQIIIYTTCIVLNLIPLSLSRCLLKKEVK